jgi:hypothetical protein
MDFKETQPAEGIILVFGIIAACCVIFGIYDAWANHNLF